MSSRKLLSPLLVAGNNLRDMGIAQAGDPCVIEPALETDIGRYNVKKTHSYGETYDSHLVVEWDDYRTTLGDIFFAHEEPEPLRASAKFCDDIPEGSRVTIPSALGNGMQTEVFLVTQNSSSLKGTAYSRVIQLVPYKGSKVQ